MKHHIGMTIDVELFKKIERLRGRERRSTFIEHFDKVGGIYQATETKIRYR